MVLWCCSIVFLVDVRGDASNQWWNFGAALSFKPFSTHYTFHGGFSALGAGSGSLCVHLASIVGSAAWYYGATLSFITSYYAYRGGPSSDGYACGMFYIPFNGTPSFANWHRGAALCVHIMLFVAVPLPMVPIVVCFLIELMILMEIAIGILVLFYSTHYALRGGFSYYDTYCGAFYIHASLTADFTNWYFGAALDIASYYAIRGGSCTTINLSGIFYVRVYNSASDKDWDYGAALSLLHIILCVVVILIMVPIAVLFVLIVLNLLYIFIGLLVLLYHTSYYARRGGFSDNGLICGAFYASCNHEPSTTDRVFGAALL